MTQNSIENYVIFKQKQNSPRVQQLKLKHSVSLSTTEDSLFSNASISDQFSQKILSCLTVSDIQVVQSQKQVKYQETELQNQNYNKISNYKLLQIVGRGNFGKVYRGIFLPNCQEVAIKIINFNQFENQYRNDVVTFYQNQVQLMKQIKKKASFRFTCHFYGAFFHENCGYIIMEFLEGFSLSQIIQSQIELTKSEEKFYLASLVLALQQLHQNIRCLHRDIKPENLMVLSNGELKILDFGCAKKLIDKDQRASSITGTCEYFSPSRFKCDYGVEADVWSFGVTAYELATKKLPFSFKGIEDSQEQQKFIKLSSVVRKQKKMNFKQLEDYHPHFKNLIQDVFNSIMQPQIHRQQHLQRIKNSNYFQQFEWDLLRRNKLKPPRTFSLKQINKIREEYEIIFNNF